MMVEYLLSLDIGLRNAYEKINDVKYASMTHDVELFHYELQEIKKYSYRQVIRTAFNTITRYQEYITNALTVTFIKVTIRLPNLLHVTFPSYKNN